MANHPIYDKAWRSALWGQDKDQFIRTGITVLAE